MDILTQTTFDVDLPPNEGNFALDISMVDVVQISGQQGHLHFWINFNYWLCVNKILRHQMTIFGSQGPTKMGCVTEEALQRYIELSEKLANNELQYTLMSFFERPYTLLELMDWLHAKVKWTEGPIIRHRDPLEIIDFGKGRCGEFSILFTALCLAHKYRARLILDMSDHVWTEVWDNDQQRWIHVDPSEKRIDDPLMYERDWKKNLTRVYALENGKVENVTMNYKM